MHTCVCVYDCVYTYIYIYTHIHVHVYIYIYIYIYICIYVLYTNTLKRSLRTSGTFPATEGTARIAGPAAKATWPNDRNYEIQGLPTIYHKTSKHTCSRCFAFQGFGACCGPTLLDRILLSRPSATLEGVGGDDTTERYEALQTKRG